MDLNQNRKTWRFLGLGLFGFAVCFGIVGCILALDACFPKEKPVAVWVPLVEFLTGALFLALAFYVGRKSRLAWERKTGIPESERDRPRKQVVMRSSPLTRGLAGLALAAGIIWFWAGPGHSGPGARITSLNYGTNCSPASLSTLLALPASVLPQVEIGRMNLLCAQGLSGADAPDLNTCLSKLEEMALRVRSETERHFYRFQKNPADFESSEGFFRMMMLAVVLVEDFGVRYSPARIGTAADARSDDGFFADAQAVFLTGVTGPSRQGTCSSLPVLQVAVGRRLGYPLKLVATKGHLFLRWEDAHERFNIEAAGRGVSRFPDDYYRHWPLEVTPPEEAAEGYLKSLTPCEEFAVFLSIRGMCLREAVRLPEAAQAFAAAAGLAPTCRGYQVMLASLQTRLGPGIPAANAQVEQIKAKDNRPDL